MGDFKRWAERYKELCVLTGIFGLLLSPFLWPFFLAIVFNSLTIAVPALLVVLIIKQPWKEKAKDEKQESYKTSENGEKSVEKPSPSVDSTSNCAAKETKHVPEGQPKRAQPIGPKTQTRKGMKIKQETMDEDTSFALTWYRMEGRERVFRLLKKLEKEQIGSLSVSQEGICSVKEGTRFRRVGVLRDFPKNRIETISKELQKEGFRTHFTKDRYLWIIWKNQEVRR